MPLNSALLTQDCSSKKPFYTNKRKKELKIMTDFKARNWLLNIFLKKFILHLKQKELGLWYIGNVLTTVIYIFLV